MGCRRSIGKNHIAAVALVACLLTAAQTATAENAPADATFVPLADFDPAGMPIGTMIVTEGAYAGNVGDSLALRGSSIIFLLKPNAAASINFRLLDSQSFLRVVGQVAYRDTTNTYFVSVMSVQSAQNLVERLMTALSDPNTSSGSLYEIGSRARAWAAAHPDNRLSQLADVAVAKGLKMEDLRISPDDYDGYFRLAEKARTLLGDGSLREFYVREGVSAYVFAHGRHRAETYYNAARKAENLLPESPLAELMLEKGFLIEKGEWARSDRKDYYALAAKAKEIFGDAPRYRSLLGKALRAEHSDIPPGDYQALYVLARKIRDIYPGYADYGVIVTEAIIAEKSAMDTSDSPAWARLGDRVLFFLDDRIQAAFCFKEAFRLDPGNSDAASRLRELGYVYYQRRWWRPEEFGRKEVFEKAQNLEKLAAAGEVAVGMTRPQVLRARGEPDAVNFSAGGWGHTVQWVYSDDGGSLYVTFIADVVIARGRYAAGG